ncbi:MAG: TolC family protein, partial [Myxococcota bacterium]
MHTPLVGLLVLFSATADAAQPLSLAEALALAADNNPDVRVAELSLRQADAGAQSARASSDPTLSLSGERSVSETQNFLGGFPTSIDADTSGAELSLSGLFPTGTSWSVSTGLDQDLITTVTSFGGPGTENEQIQDTQAGSLNLTVSQDLLVFFRDTPTQIAIREARQQQDTARLQSLQTQQQAM